MERSGKERLIRFLKKSLLGGLVVLLPLGIVFFIFRWLYRILVDVTSPVASLVVSGFGLPPFVADLIGVAALVGLCFVVGNLVTTGPGRRVWESVENQVMGRLPGYRTVREVIAQVLGSDQDNILARGEVARVWLYGRDVDVSVLALVTSHHEDGRVSLFVPTGPNPTSGFIYHASRELVTLCPEIRVDEMMKAVVACGAGSGNLFATLPEARLEPGARTELDNTREES